MPSGWSTNLSNLSSSLNASQGSSGLGGVTAGADVLYSQFSDLKSAMGYFKTFVDNLNATGWLTEWDIADSAVTSAKIADGTIVAGDLADGAVTSAKILDGTIVAGDLASNSVTSAKIASSAVTTSKIGTIPACRLYKQADSTIADSTEVTINFSGASDEVFDTASMHSSSTNPSRITATTAGIYLVQGNINWPYDAGGGRRVVYLKKNGSVIASTSEMQVSTSGASTFQNLSTIVNADSTSDYFELSVLQYSGGSMTIAGGGSGSPVLSVVWVGPAA